MSTSALLDPDAPVRAAAAEAADEVVRTLVRLAAQQGRRYVERLESLVALEVLGERAEPVLGAAVWAAEAYGSDAATILAWLAGQTTKIRLASGIFQIPARSAAMTAMTADSQSLVLTTFPEPVTVVVVSCTARAPTEVIREL